MDYEEDGGRSEAMTEQKYPEVTKRERRHLARLETLVDSIYALVIVIIVAGFPSARQFDGEFSSPWDFLSRHSDELVAPALGLILILMYWAQSNVQLGSLERTDTFHATLVIVQLILLLTYVYSVDFLLDFPGDNTVLTAQSVIFLLMGVISFIAWRRATHGRRLVDDGISEDELSKIGREILPEPLTAFLTIWASFLGATAWEVAWLAVLPITWVVNRVGRT
jgi:uncharacterized membrane protein